MLFIDMPDGTVVIPFTSDALTAAEIARKEHGRLRMMISRDMDTRDPMVGCIQLGDWRPKDGTDA